MGTVFNTKQFIVLADNIFDKNRLPLPDQTSGEVLETLLNKTFSGSVRIERILSFGASDGEWYDQAWDEWVMVARGEAKLEWEDGSVEELTAGDYLLIESGRKHRVLCTSYDCVWLALHFGQ